MPSKDKKQWQRDTLEPAVRRFPERREKFQTDSGLDIDSLYSPEDLQFQGLDYDNDLGYPGEYPYTRGVQPNTYRGRVWTMRQYSGYGSAAETNERFRYLLDQGQTGLSIAFDLPTQIGYDSDHVLAKGEVGKVGVPICSLEDMETLFAGIPMNRVSTSMTINATASLLLCFY
ncbi:MAG: methylmalonyl-CoA mutase family protein, partial [Chloroflexota bacterium]|nr:methylmalonyl-CoA mutase family protein [Chloroflexota bacterium]